MLVTPMTATAAELELAQLVAQAVQLKFKSLPKSGKNQPHEHTVLAGIVAYYDPKAAAGQPPQHSSCTAHVQPATASPTISTTAAYMHVVALGTGTKCLGASKRSTACDVINDSHAEVVTRRAFVAWVYQQLQLTVQQDKQSQQQQPRGVAPEHVQVEKTQQDQQHVAVQPNPRLCQTALVWCPDTCKFTLRNGLKFAMYVSQPPCGDASIYSAEQQLSTVQGEQLLQRELQQTSAAAGRTGAKLIRLSGTADVGQAAAAIAGAVAQGSGEDSADQPSQGAQQQQQGIVPCVPCASDVEAGPQQLGVLRRKPGKGDATLSLSCSDKLARWACLGLQGCLLSSCLVAPLHLDLVVVAVPPASTAAAARAQPAEGATAAAAADMQYQPQLQQHQQQQAVRLKEVEAAAMRAFSGRLQGCAVLLQPPFALRPPLVVALQAADSALGLYPDEARNSPSGVSINWSCQLPLLSVLTAPPAKPSAAAAAGVHEVTLAAYGRKAGAGRNAPNWNNSKTRSRLCSAALYEQWQALAALLPALQQFADALAVRSIEMDTPGHQGAAAGDGQRHAAQWLGVTDRQLDSRVYRAEKNRVGQGYQHAWSTLRKNSQSVFAGWLAKP